jgi:acyl carrier protein
VDATVCSVRGAPEPVIGRPIANTKIFLLDERLNPVPIGVPGELHIGGDGLARGYLNRADLTAERFIPNPFNTGPGARLYKTGDLASYLPDGVIKFLGRTDHQVKLRGFRIELGEIEAALKRGPDVQDGVVVVREDTPGDKRLVAYVVLARGRESSLGELRGFLKEKLPEYMIPSAFVRLNDLPLTRHGKVDRQSLPAPESERPELRASYVEPRTRIEGTIAAIWQEVLRVEKVGVDDNFFDLGGHSLLMVQVHSGLREAFSKEISLIEMFRNPTVGLLARYFAGERDQQPLLQKAHDRAQKRRRARGRQAQM